jgi:hypothetical protein
VIVLTLHLQPPTPGQTTITAGHKRLLVGLIATWLICFALRPESIPGLPNQDLREMSWTLPQHITGNLFIIWALVYLIVMWPLAKTLNPIKPTFC